MLSQRCDIVAMWFWCRVKCVDALPHPTVMKTVSAEFLQVPCVGRAKHTTLFIVHNLPNIWNF